MNLIYMHPTGPMLRVDSEHTLYIDDLNPESKRKWRLSRWELFSIGWGLIMSAVFRPDPETKE